MLLDKLTKEMERMREQKTVDLLKKCEQSGEYQGYIVIYKWLMEHE